MFKKVILDNGLTIVMSAMPRMESISIGIWIKAGGRYEKKEQGGISHFLEHMVFKGTKKRSSKELKESIEGRGGLLNAFTGEEFTCYLAKVLAKDAAIAIDVLSDMVLQPKLDRADFLKERLVILEEIKMYMDMPNHYVQELLAELLWPNQPLGRSLAGTFQTVSKMTQKDLEVYRNDRYNPGNIVISIAGKLRSDEIFRVIRRIFGTNKAGKVKTFQAVNLTQDKPAANFYFKETEQTHVAMGIHGYDRFSVYKYALDIFQIILGGNMSSRLFNEVRERSGLAYEISSSVKHYHDTGALVISAGIDNGKVEKAMAVILKVLREMKKNGVTREEFQRAKEFYRGQLLMLFEDTMNDMLWLGEKFVSADMEYRAGDVLRRLDAVKIDDIKYVARDIIKPASVNLAVVGPTRKASQSDIAKRLRDL